MNIEISALAKQINDSNKKADLIRNKKLTCSCCKTKVDNTIGEYGYNKCYFLVEEKFLCECCYLRNLIFKNLDIILLFTLVRTIERFNERFNSKLYMVPYKLLHVAEHVAKHLYECSSNIENNICKKMHSYSMTNYEIYKKYYKKWICINSISQKIFKVESLLWHTKEKFFEKQCDLIKYECGRESLDEEVLYLL